MFGKIRQWLEQIVAIFLGKPHSRATVGRQGLWYNCPYLRVVVELTDERRSHITIRNPDVTRYLNYTGDDLENPDEIRTSQRDLETLIFYQEYRRMLNGKSLAVAVKRDGRSFILSAYLTRARVNGEVLWARN